MSSRASHSWNGDDRDSAQENKRRRTQRACDMCRLKRVRCEGGQMSYRACDNCVVSMYDCTYTQAATKVKSSNSDKAYIRSLESRLEKMETLMKKLAPEDDPSNDSEREASSFVLNTAKKVLSPPPSLASMSPRIPVDEDDVDSSEDEYSARQSLDELFQSSMKFDPGRKHFFGKSSSFMLLQTAMDIRQEFSRENTRESSPSPLSQSHWGADPWMETLLKRPKFIFPPPDLMAVLVPLYFSWHNIYVPLLHRPTFEQAIADGLHLRDDGFADTVLLVCALAARHCDDPRVLVEGYDNHRSAGWQWFHQAHSAFQLVNYAPPRLHDLQTICLISHFLHGSSSPYSSWPVIGVGLRLAQALGAHRRKAYDAGPSVETELLKRAFWVLVTQDRGLSSGLGRPCGMQDEDFDVELPLECDDEYWMHSDPNQAFKQPLGKPSRVAFFNSTIRLNQIHAFALRTIYSINKSRATLGYGGPKWEEKIVAEIDSALNNFIDSIPDHLRWNPHEEDMLFLNQSALLYAQYYSLQITVHRQFIPSPRRPSRSSFPSLAICTNAARSCIHVLDNQFRRAQETDQSSQVLSPIHTLFTSGTVLLLNIWGQKRFGSSIANSTRDLLDVHKAMTMLKACESRSYAAGKLREVLYGLASFGDLPLPSFGIDRPNIQGKRAREAESDKSIAIPHASSLSAAQDSRFSTTYNAVIHPPESPQLFGSSMPVPLTLPLYGQDLGRLPLYLQDTSVTAELQFIPPLPIGMSDSPSLLNNCAHFTQGSLATPLARAEASSKAASYPPEAVTRAESSAQITSAVAVQLPPTGDHIASSTWEQDMLEMWSTAPVGFEWEDWGNYLTSFGGHHNTNNS